MRLFGIPLALFGFFAVAWEPCSGAMLGALAFLVMLPVEFVSASSRVKKQTPKIVFRQPKPEPKPPSRAALLADLREEYESTLVDLHRAGLSKIELRAAKRKAKQLYLRKIDSLMGE